MKLIQRITILLTTLVLTVATFLSGQANLSAFNFYKARASSVNQFDLSYVIDDLKDSFIGNSNFSFDNYSYSQSKKTEVISVLEYGYSSNYSKCNNYGLYLYIYNPQNIKYSYRSELNTVSMRVANKGKYNKYKLRYLNHSIDSNNDNLFIKYKIDLTSTDIDIMLLNLSADKRIYEISDLELFNITENDVDLIGFSKTIKYTGYMQGLSELNSVDSTLNCTYDHLTPVEFEVFPTAYNIDSKNENNTRDSLHSVYFRVDNDYLNKYGMLSEISARYKSALLAPGLVVGYQEVYDAIEPFLGKEMGEKTHNSELDYCILDYTRVPNAISSIPSAFYIVNFIYNYLYSFNLKTLTYNDYSYVIDPLYLMFYSGAIKDSSDSYNVPSVDLKSKIEELSTISTGYKIDDKYLKNLFSKYDETFTYVNYSSTDTLKITTSTIKEVFNLLGISIGKYEYLDNDVLALYPVSDKDFESNDINSICDKLLIDIADYDNFKNCYELAKANNETLYLFRYRVSEFASKEVTIYKRNDSVVDTWDSVGTNAYIFQRYVDLGFDVISLTFSDNDCSIIMPVMSKPVDNFGNISSPLDTSSDDEGYWKLIIAFILGLALLIIAWPVVSPVIGFVFKGVFVGVGYIFKATFIVITSPFKLFKKRRRK